MIKTVWASRIAKQLAAVCEQEAEFQAALNRERRERSGKMPHWSTYEMRVSTVTGKALPVSHALRPANAAIGNKNSLCGWHEASFQAANRFGFPSATLYPCPSTLKKFGEIADLVGCPICWDVINDISTWIELVSSVGFPKEKARRHLYINDADVKPACGYTNQITLVSKPESFKKTQVFVEDVHCEVCTAIYERLWGQDRPEAAYLTFTTNEEAQNSLRFARKLRTK